MQLVVPSAVRNAVSAATITFTASSMIRCFFIISSFLFFVTQISQIYYCHTEIHRNHRNFTSSGLFKSHRNSQKSRKFYVLWTIIRNKKMISSLSVRSLCRRHFP